MATGSPRRRGTECVSIACEHTLGREPLHLYGYLWTKPDAASDCCGAFSFVLTDTVLFKHQRPVRWFFTSKLENGKILCKSKKHATVTHILQAFLEPKLESVHRKDAGENALVVATFAYAERASGTGELVQVVEHLTKPALRDLLMFREKPSLGILQRFIPTRSGYNHMIQSVYTPDSCLIRKCINSRLESDTKHSIAARMATFEADEKNITPRDVSNRDVREKIEHMNVEMSSHLGKIVQKEVTRQVSYFKIGLDNRIYLLWSTMVSFETGARAFAKHHELSISACDRLEMINVATREQPRADASLHSILRTCPSCCVAFPREQVEFLVTFKSVVKHFEADESGNSDTDRSIPPLLETLLAPIQEERFKELMNDVSFLYRTIRLCQACAHKFNARRTHSRSKSPTPAVLEQPMKEDIPVYMQSAHTIFWGKVEREKEQTPQQNVRGRIRRRPASAAAVNTRFHGHPSQTTAIGFQHQGSRVLPYLTTKSASIVTAEPPQHCLHRLAQHLQQTVGGPSMRLALSRANIYPQKPMVSLDTLQWVCSPKLLADVFAYWSAFCRSQGTAHNAAFIDMDALDGMLSSCLDPAISVGLGSSAISSKEAASPGDASQMSGMRNKDVPGDNRTLHWLQPVPLRPFPPRSCIPTSRSFRSRQASIQAQSSHLITCLAPAVETPRAQMQNACDENTPAPEIEHMQVAVLGEAELASMHIDDRDPSVLVRPDHDQCDGDQPRCDGVLSDQCDSSLSDHLMDPKEAPPIEQTVHDGQPNPGVEPISHHEATAPDMPDVEELTEEEFQLLQETLAR